MKSERIARGAITRRTTVKSSIDWRGVAEVDHPTESPGYLLWRISAAWQRRIRAALKPYGISHAQFVLLTCLTWLQDRHEAPVTQVTLADQAGLDKVTTGDVLATLEKVNLIKRRPHATDKRAWEVVATPTGRAKVARALPDVVAVDRAFFGALGKEGGTLLGLMQRLDSAAQDR